MLQKLLLALADNPTSLFDFRRNGQEQPHNGDFSQEQLDAISKGDLSALRLLVQKEISQQWVYARAFRKSNGKDSAQEIAARIERYADRFHHAGDLAAERAARAAATEARSASNAEVARNVEQAFERKYLELLIAVLSETGAIGSSSESAFLRAQYYDVHQSPPHRTALSIPPQVRQASQILACGR